MTSAIENILIHDEIYYTMICLNQCSTLYQVQSWYFNRKKSKALNKVTKSHTMLAQDSFLGSLLVLPVECGMELLDETTIKYTETGGTYGYPNSLFWCSAWVTEPNSTQQVRYVGIQ